MRSDSAASRPLRTGAGRLGCKGVGSALSTCRSRGNVGRRTGPRQCAPTDGRLATARSSASGIASHLECNAEFDPSPWAFPSSLAPHRAAQEQLLRVEPFALTPLVLVHQHAAQLREPVRRVVERRQDDRSFVDLEAEQLDLVAQGSLEPRSASSSPPVARTMPASSVTESAVTNTPASITGTSVSLRRRGLPCLHLPCPGVVPRPPSAALPTPSTGRDRPHLIVRRFPAMPAAHHTSEFA